MSKLPRFLRPESQKLTQVAYIAFGLALLFYIFDADKAANMLFLGGMAALIGSFLEERFEQMEKRIEDIERRL